MGCLRIRVLETQYGWAEAKVANLRWIGLGDASTKKVRCLERYIDLRWDLAKRKVCLVKSLQYFGGWNVGDRKSDQTTCCGLNCKDRSRIAILHCGKCVIQKRRAKFTYIHEWLQLMVNV